MKLLSKLLILCSGQHCDRNYKACGHNACCHTHECVAVREQMVNVLSHPTVIAPQKCISESFLFSLKILQQKLGETTTHAYTIVAVSALCSAPPNTQHKQITETVQWTNSVKVKDECGDSVGKRQIDFL